MRDDAVCDFCYNRSSWKFVAKHVAGQNIWEFVLCDSCRLLLRNVIGPVLHRMSHTDFVSAIVTMMSQRGLTYEDLMRPLQDIKALEPVRDSEEVPPC